MTLQNGLSPSDNTQGLIIMVILWGPALLAVAVFIGICAAKISGDFQYIFESKEDRRYRREWFRCMADHQYSAELDTRGIDDQPR